MGSTQSLRRIAGGAFGDVFDLGDGTVLKAYFEMPPESGLEADRTLVPRIVFSAEREFYRRLRDYPDLEVYCPAYFGEVNPNEYRLGSINSYPTGCGIVLEKIPGRDVKLSELAADIEARASAVIEEMKQRTGLDHPWDGSCFVPGTRAPFTLIDVAAPAERLDALPKIVAKHGGVPQKLLRRLGLQT